MHKNHLQPGLFIHIKETQLDTFGRRLLIKEIEAGILICFCLTDGSQKTLRYMIDTEDTVSVDGYKICTHLSEQTARYFIRNRAEFLKEEARKAELAVQKHEKVFEKYLI